MSSLAHTTGKTDVATIRGRAILFSEMTPPPGHEDAFHDWYDREHIPARMRAPGFVSAQRYRALDGRGFLAVYDMTSLAALATPEYRVIKTELGETTRWMLKNVTGFTRYLGEEIACQRRDGVNEDAAMNSRVLYSVWFNVPAERTPDFDSWYEQEHMPLLLRCSDWLMIRRFRIADGEPERWSHLALHYLNDVRALESAERQQARTTPWRDRLAAEPWFKGKYTLFERLKERHHACPPM
jgi:hypothetical protein